MLAVAGNVLYKDLNAQVAKLVDALCSGRSACKGVLVRIQSWAPSFKHKQAFHKVEGFFVCDVLKACFAAQEQTKKLPLLSSGALDCD